MAKVTVTSNKGIFINAMKSQIEAALTDCGLDAQNFAMDKFHTYSWSGWSTGRLVGSITYEVEVTSAKVGKMIVA